jgi:TolB-like protein
MKKKMIIMISAMFIITLFTFPGLVGKPLSYGETVKRVAILPFTMNAERDLSFLRKGITDMLASRLNWPGKVEIIQKNVVLSAMAGHTDAVDAEMANRVGRKLKADYVLYGSLTVFGQSVSMDATMVGLDKKKPPVTVFVQTKGMEAVIPEVNKFAHKVNAKIFGRPYADAEYAVVPNRYARPYDSRVSPLNPYFARYHGVRIQDTSLWKSKSFEMELRGMALGDVTGDGNNEVVLLEGIKIAVYSFQKGQKGALSLLARHESFDNQLYISVDVADINGNGKAEIFASKVRGSIVSSEVLEMDKGRLRPVVRRSPWLFRVTTLPERGEVLLGQHISGRILDEVSLQPDLIKDYFDKGIYLLQWKDKRYRKAEEEPLFKAPGLYIFNFVMADLGGDPGPEIVMIDQNDKLRVLDAEGNELHKSSDNFGGTINYVVPNPNIGGTDAGDLDERHIYIPARIVIADLDQDGRNEIIINRNKSETYGLTERFKAFSDGHIVSLTWTGLSLEPIWESRKLSGCLADYQVEDLDNDGNMDLAVALIQKRKVKGMTKPKSVVVSYRLQMKEEEKKEKK